MFKLLKLANFEVSRNQALTGILTEQKFISDCRYRVIESSSLVPVLFREVFSHPYISFFHLLVLGRPSYIINPKKDLATSLHKPAQACKSKGLFCSSRNSLSLFHTLLT